MKEMAKNPELLKENPVFYQMKEIYDNEEDMLFY